MNFLKDLSVDKVRNLAEDAINQAKPKTDVEARVYEVLSHKNWGASSSLMHEIARDTFDAERFYIVSRLMWDGMENQRPAAWKVVFKALTLLEFLVKNGAERCVDDARNHGHVLRALGKFNYYEGTVDRGLGVREKSKQILDLLTSDDLIREERQRARKLREKFRGNVASSANAGGGRGSGYDNYGQSSGGGGYGNGGIDSGNGGYSGRYGNSASAPAPTFAAMPAEKKKKKKKKKPVAAAPEPAAAPEVDLFSFDAPAAAPAAAPAGNDDFANFQSAGAPAPAAAADEFDAFGAMRSANQSGGGDPFAASAPAPQQQVAASFDAFGNNNAAAANNMGAMNNNMGGMNQNNNMNAMNNAFGAMNVSQQPQTGMMQPNMQAAPQVAAPAATGGDDDEFGDFAGSSPAPAPAVMVSSAVSNDPMSKLISLDGLTKNKPKQSQQNQNQFGMGGNNGMGGMSGMGQNNNNMGMPNNGMPAGPVVVSAGGSDAISSMMGPVPTQQPNPQMQQQQQQPQQQGQQNQQQMNNMMGNQMNMMGGNQMGNMQGMNMMGMNPQMMQQQMAAMQGGMNPQMMNQMGNMQGNNMGMNNMQGGMNPQMMMNQMGGMNNMQGGMNPQMMNQMGGMGMNQQFR